MGVNAEARSKQLYSGWKGYRFSADSLPECRVWFSYGGEATVYSQMGGK